MTKPAYYLTALEPMKLHVASRLAYSLAYPATERVVCGFINDKGYAIVTQNYLVLTDKDNLRANLRQLPFKDVDSIAIINPSETLQHCALNFMFKGYGSVRLEIKGYDARPLNELLDKFIKTER